MRNILIKARPLFSRVLYFPHIPRFHTRNHLVKFVGVKFHEQNITVYVMVKVRGKRKVADGGKGMGLDLSLIHI